MHEIFIAIIKINLRILFFKVFPPWALKSASRALKPSFNRCWVTDVSRTARGLPSRNGAPTRAHPQAFVRFVHSERAQTIAVRWGAEGMALIS